MTPPLHFCTAVLRECELASIPRSRAGERMTRSEFCSSLLFNKGETVDCASFLFLNAWSLFYGSAARRISLSHSFFGVGVTQAALVL